MLERTPNTLNDDVTMRHKAAYGSRQCEKPLILGTILNTAEKFNKKICPKHEHPWHKFNNTQVKSKCYSSAKIFPRL